LRASLAGDHVRVLAKTPVSRNDLSRILLSGGLTSIRVDPSSPVMEDMFMSLVSH